MFQKNTDYQFDDVQDHQDDVETVVGPSVHVEGDFASEGNIVVKGMVSGSVKTSRQLTVVEGAKILANVKAGSASISGHIKGNLQVADILEITESAQILGDITCTTLIVAPGAKIHGKVTMKGMDIPESKTSRRRSSRVKKAEPVVAEAEEEGAEDMAA